MRLLSRRARIVNAIDNPISPRGDGNTILLAKSNNKILDQISITPFPREGTETGILPIGESDRHVENR